MSIKHGTIPLLGILAILSSPIAKTPDPLDRSSELTAIEATLNHYLEGGRSGDIDRLRRAFHPAARLQFVRDGVYGEWSLEEYLGRRTPGERSDHIGRVLLIDFAGNAATAKLESDYGEFRFIDYMSLLKVDGRWLIVNKIFHREESW